LPLKVMTVGPTVGFYYFGYNKTIKNDTLSKWQFYNESDAYLFGGKIAIILGEKKFRFIIKQLILFGVKQINGNTKFGIQPITNLGIMFTF
jgi:hypothetical protein